MIERRAEAASETSFANAGLVAPGHAFAWASPKAAEFLLKSLFQKDQPLRFRFRAEPALWRWSLQFLAQCTSARARRNTRIKHRLCRYAQAALQDVVARTGIAYDGERRGVLYLHRWQATSIAAPPTCRSCARPGRSSRSSIATAPPRSIRRWRPAGTKSRARSTAQATRAAMPASSPARSPTVRGARRELPLRHHDLGIEAGGERIERVLTDQGELRADLYLLACGSYSPLLTRGLGERLSVYPIKGYSLTLPIDGANNPPTVGGVDEDNLCAYVRLGDPVRSTTIAEFAGYDTSHTDDDFRSMLTALRDLFPSGADYTRPQYWACLRPMTPEGTPVLGRGKFENLHYNTGHGHRAGPWPAARRGSPPT